MKAVEEEHYHIRAPGKVSHGNQRSICTPPIWADFFIFYATNYVFPAPTLPRRPGEGIIETCFAVMTTLFLPSTGFLQAARWHLAHARTVRRDELSRATSAMHGCQRN
ncbi:hypothetical protein LY76DRAFT_100097 [Colletotrichum caudatum]|nr:hypothetical protein LY76DRAFT_100097 [Colletotrichum caudatum]